MISQTKEYSGRQAFNYTQNKANMGFFSRLERIAAGLYFAWFFMHLGFLFLSQDDKENLKFWPVNSGDTSLFLTYDFSEFVVYIGFPLVLLVAYRMINSYDPTSAPGEIRRSSRSFFTAFLREKITVAKLQLKLDELNQQPIDTSQLNQLEKDLEIITSKGISNWLGKSAIRKKYRAFES